jgi:hypothetical protein
MLVNGNFSDGWETLPAIAEANWLRNQRPNGWQIEWLAQGQPLYDDPGARANGIPECIHKLDTQLPAHEQMGQPAALILDGNAVYKIFSSGSIFGATLSQTVTGLQPGDKATLTVPIQVHLHGETDAYGAESSVWVNGVGGWVNGFDMGDRNWYRHKIEFTVPDNGTAEVVIQVKSKWPLPKDFFFDGITLDAQPAAAPPPPPIVEQPDTSQPPPVTTGPAKTVFVQLPAGVQIKKGVCDEANVVEVNAGPGVKIEVV